MGTICIIMKYIYITSSSLAKYTGHNTYEPIEKVVQEILIKNNLRVGEIPKTKLEEEIVSLSEESVAQLKVDLKLPDSSDVRAITKAVQAIVKPSLISGTEDGSRNEINKGVTEVNSEVLKTLIPSIQQDVRMFRGCKREANNLDKIQTSKGIQITERNSKMYCGELYRCEEYVVMLRGKVDGQSDDTIIESKNRTKCLFKVLRGYEQVQLESYMFLTGLNKALLTEHYNDTHHCIEYIHDEEFWKECLEKMVEFMEKYVRPVLLQ